MPRPRHLVIFSFNDTATTEIYTLSLHDALPIFQTALVLKSLAGCLAFQSGSIITSTVTKVRPVNAHAGVFFSEVCPREDRKSTRLNSSHSQISYAVFCLKKKNYIHTTCDTERLI